MTPPLVATYRLQFHRGFGFADAEALVPYLAGLGVSHLYASPITTAVPGSTHGYDVTDPTRINPELGGEEGFVRLAEALARHGMGVVVDIVPNHMAASHHNPFWMAMLEGGPGSAAARVFDVRWESGKLLVPILADPLKTTLEEGRLSLRADPAAGRIVVAYGDAVLPLSAGSVADLLDAAVLLDPAAGREPTLGRLAAAFREVAASSTSPDLRPLLGGLGEAERRELDDALARADLAAVLEAQHWRLAWWRTAAHQLNYRRFFSISTLAGVRVEDEAVFDLVHRLPLDLIRRGLVHGLRVDHVDGLVDPAGYCRRLRAAVGPEVPIVVEKILEPGEKLRPWPIDGTTGYERLNDINGVFVDPDGWARLEARLRERNLLVGTAAERTVAAKRQVLATSLAAEVAVLVTLARVGLDAAMAAADVTEAALADAVVALLAHCPVYRSYATAAGHDADDVAVWRAQQAAVEANENPLTAAAAALLIERMENPTRPSDHEFRSRFQQLSGPAMAKGFEDTELYRYPVLLSVNEVGGSLEHPARTHEALHEIAAARTGARDLVPLATHDTKRGPGARARLTALAFAPERWLDFADEIETLTAPFVSGDAAGTMPDPLDRHFILQTLISVWPIDAARMQEHLTKALREAKRHTDWETPNEAYEAAALAYVSALVEAPEAVAPRRRIGDFVGALAPIGRIVGAAQLVLQTTLPGTPDIYQGTEFPDFSLVDPDNRRSVDWRARVDALAGRAPSDPADDAHFRLTRLLLAMRRRNPALTAGDHRPIATAPSPWAWFAFERRSGEHAVRVAVPTRVPPDGEWRSAATIEFAEPLGDGWRTPEGDAVDPAGRCEIAPRRPCFLAERG